MESQPLEPGDLEPGDVYRSVAGRILVPVGTLIVAVVVVIQLVTGQVARGVLVGVWLVAVAIAAHLLFVRPAVRVDARGVLLLNPVRDVFVPWEDLVAVRTRFALTLVTADSSYVSWAATAPGRPVRSSWRGGSEDADIDVPRVMRGDGSAVVPASRGLNGDSGAAAFLVEAAWSSWRQDGGRPVRRDDGGTRGAGPSGDVEGTGGDARSGDARSGDARSGDATGREGSGVRVTWHLVPVGVAVLAAAAGILLALTRP